MNRVTDIFSLGREAMNQTTELIKEIPLILVVPVVHFMAYFGVMNLPILRLGTFSGIILTLVTAVILSSYLYVLHQAIYYRRFRIKDLYQGIQFMFMKTWFFLIVFSLVNYVIALTGGALLGPLAMIIPLMLFNPMPEIIYISEYNERDMFFYNFNFIKRNFLPWYAVNLLLLLGLLVILLVGGLVVYLANMILVVYVGYAMVLRGFLFKTLHHSNYRKRQFNRFRK